MHGDSFVQNIWKEVDKRPAAQTTQDAVDNFIIAASLAVDENLTTLFVDEWRWPLSQSARDELAQYFEEDVLSNLIQNPSFEEGAQHWHFFTNGQGNFTVGPPATADSQAAHIEIVQSGSNVQLYQSAIQLEPHTRYLLYFHANSNSGHDLRVYLHKHGAPYTNYGLNTARFDLTPENQTFVWNFETANFENPVADARLRFWLAPFAEAGDSYSIDQVVLVKNPPVINAAGIDTIYPLGNMMTEDDEVGLMAGGIVQEEAIRAIYLPLIIHE